MTRFPWHNEHPLTATEVAAALPRDIPELAGAHVERLGEGWDFVTFLVAGKWLLRFPKRRSSERALKKEIRALNALHGTLAVKDVAVPQYRWVVENSDAFALMYAGYPFIAGTSLVHTAPTPERLALVSQRLGRFLADLHAQKPVPPPRRFNDQFAGHFPEFRQQLVRLHGVLPQRLSTAINSLFELPYPRFVAPPRFCHADLLLDHILLSSKGPDDGSGNEVAVIDWGDARWDDPWSDFVGLWTWAGDRAVRHALTHYPLQPSTEDWTRIRYKGVYVCMSQVYYGHFDAQPGLVAVSIEALERIMQAGQILDPSRAEPQPDVMAV